MSAMKIATCSYCGTRAALVLRGRERHELSCSACGAPLHEMKMLKVDHAGLPARPAALRTGPMAEPARRAPVDMPRKAKRRKGFGRRLFEEAIDLVEDILD
jgi:hypothetical protein